MAAEEWQGSEESVPQKRQKRQQQQQQWEGHTATSMEKASGSGAAAVWCKWMNGGRSKGGKAGVQTLTCIQSGSWALAQRQGERKRQGGLSAI